MMNVFRVLSDLIIEPVEPVESGCSISGFFVGALIAAAASVVIAGAVVLIVLLVKRKKRRGDN